MTDILQSCVQQSQKALRASLLETVKKRYFPEIWYLLENWFSLSRKKGEVLVVGATIMQLPIALVRSGWNVTVIDPSFSLLEELSKQIEELGLKAQFEQGDPENIPKPASSYGMVISINMIEFSKRPSAVLNELNRVTTAEGHCIIATFNRRSPWGFQTIANVIRKDQNSPSASFLSRSEFIDLIKHQGFALKDFKDKTHYLPVGLALNRFAMPVAGAFAAYLTKAQPAPGTDDERKELSKKKHRRK